MQIKAESGEKPLHRPRSFKKDEMKKEKADKKLSWYKGKDGKSFNSVLMIPVTPNGELRKPIE